MARKRKKSRRRRNKAPETSTVSGADASDEGVEQGATEVENPDEAVAFPPLHDTEHHDLNEDTSSDPDDDVAVIDLDEDVIEVDVDAGLDESLAEAAAREQLIAAAAALDDPDLSQALAQKGGLDAAPSSPVEASKASGAAEGPPGAEGEAEAPAAAAEAASETPAGATPAPPQINSDALVALSQMHAEGLATIAGELVLDLGGDTLPEDRDRLLAAAMAHSEMQEAIYRVRADEQPIHWWKGGVVAVLLFIATVVAVQPPRLVTPAPAPTLSQADRLHGVRVALLIQAQQVEAFRSRELRLPDSLGDLPASLPGIRFVKSGNRLFQLVARAPNGRAVVYDSASPAPEFQQIRRSWITTRDAS